MEISSAAGKGRDCKLSRVGGGDRVEAVVRPVPWLSLDLIVKIATFLPFHKIYQLRTLCKAWNALLRSPAFLDAWSTAPHEEWLVMSRNVLGPWQRPRRLSRELIAYDPAADWWIPLQHLLDSCPPAALSTLGGSSLSRVPDPSSDGNVYFSLCPMVASSGVPGLSCFLICHFPPPGPPSSCRAPFRRRELIYSLLVLNLFNGSYRPLPPPLKLFDVIPFCDNEGSYLQVSMQRLPGIAYRVFLNFHNYRMPGPLEIYDSCRGSWNVGRSCDQPGDAKIANAADLKNADLLLYLTETQTVFAYNVELDEWSQVLGQFPTDVAFCFPTLVRHEGQVFLATVLYHQPIFKGFRVWKLHLRYSGSPPSAAVPGTPVADWVEVARTPEQCWRGLYSADVHTSANGVRIVSSGSLIYMTPLAVEEEEAHNPPLVYDLVRNSWFHLSPSKAGSEPLMAAFFYVP